MKIDPQVFINQTLTFFRYGAIAGFIVCATLLINLNNKAFTYIFKDRAKQYFWFFMLLSVIPLLAIIFVFNALFGGLTFKMTPEEIKSLFNQT